MLLQSNLYMTAPEYIQQSRYILQSLHVQDNFPKFSVALYFLQSWPVYKALARLACPAILWKPIFGGDTRKIHLISYNFMGKHAFWTASFQCLA